MFESRSENLSRWWEAWMQGRLQRSGLRQRVAVRRAAGRPRVFRPVMPGLALVSED